MSEFEQMMADIQVPEAIAKSISESAISGEVAEVWEKLAPMIDDAFGNCSTAAGVCAVGMMVSYVGDQLSAQIKFGESPEDEGKNVHPNFCIMAIALLAINTLKVSRAALDAKKSESGDGEQESGKEESGKEESGKENGDGNDG